MFAVSLIPRTRSNQNRVDRQGDLRGVTSSVALSTYLFDRQVAPAIKSSQVRQGISRKHVQ